MDKAYRTPDGRVVIIASDPSRINVEEQQMRGMRPNGFPVGHPDSLGEETIMVAYRKQG